MSPAGAGDDLDYMHARYCSPVTGRFLGVDPALKSAKPTKPLSWNRYSYVNNNPLLYIDPNGKEGAEVMMTHDVQQLAQGKMTREEFRDRLYARGAGAGIGLGLLAAARGVASVGTALAEAVAVLSIKYSSAINFLRNVGAGMTDQPRVQTFATKAAARAGLEGLNLSAAQAAAANRTIGRATTASVIQVALHPAVWKPDSSRCTSNMMASPRWPSPRAAARSLHPA